MARHGYKTYYQNEYINHQFDEIRQDHQVERDPKPCFDCTAYGRPNLCNPACKLNPDN